MAYVIALAKDRKAGKPIHLCRCYSMNYGWVIPARRGWRMVYFYKNKKTSSTTIRNMTTWPPGTAVPVRVRVIAEEY